MSYVPTDPLSLPFAALADPTRRSILTRLAEGEATVGELAEPFSVSLPAISRHLKVLERAGLIVRSREAQWRPSRLQADPLDEAVGWMQSRKQTWEARMDRPGRGGGVVRPRAHGDAARADPDRPARRRALRAHDGPARRRRRVLDRLPDRRARGAGADRPALGPDAGGRHA